MGLYIIIVIVVIILLALFLTYNSFMKLNNKVKKAFSTMDVYLKKRGDLISNIVDTVKRYVECEKNTLKEIVDLRNVSYDKMSDNEKPFFTGLFKNSNEVISSNLYNSFYTTMNKILSM